MSPDIINGGFELVGAVLAWINARKLLTDKEVKGVYWPIQIFFTLWGVWNLYYYPSLGQWVSFWAGVGLVTGNAVWVILAIKYARR